MIFENEAQKNLISEIGLDPNKNYVEDDDIIELSEKISEVLAKRGFGKSPEYDINDIGIVCEEILDELSELP